MESIIIIGAGAAGLTAARKLGSAGKTIIVLEARDRIGGRIFTAQVNGFTTPIEVGAEFIHGDLPFTQALAKEAAVPLRKGEGRSWNFKAGQKEEGDVFEDGWNQFIKALKRLEHDMSIADFLNTQFDEPKYEELRESIIKFVQGFDAADANKASAFALREEWTKNENEDFTGYHLEGGYSLLMEFLRKECMKLDVSIHLSAVVKEIQWKKGSVIVTTEKGDHFTARKVLVTIPPAVLRTGAISFSPPIPSSFNAIEKIETGGVIKFFIEFHDTIWENQSDFTFRKFPHLHFLFSDAYVPTWWTQKPAPTPLLTGWLAGPITVNLSKTNIELIQNAVESLAYIFGCEVDVLKKAIRASGVINWMQDPFALGAYAYKTVETGVAIQQLSQSIEDTIYFAGEAYYDGSEMGTVEAALVSGDEKANLVLSH